MNAFLLMIPLMLIRFGLLGMISRKALGRAAFFAPLQGGERIAVVFYQLSNIFIIFYPILLKIQGQPPLFSVALAIYVLGIIVLIVTAMDFAKPKKSGINTGGIYRLSRNPMYMGYFIYFLGCVLFTRSIPLFLSWIVFIVSTHWIIISEERWCISNFREEYLDYMNKVRRYI